MEGDQAVIAFYTTIKIKGTGSPLHCGLTLVKKEFPAPTPVNKHNFI